MVIMNKILILTSGKVSKLEAFSDSVDKASFNSVWFNVDNNKLMLGDKDLKDYEVIYFRMVGKSLEVATLVSEYARKNSMQTVDKSYTDSILMPSSLGKSIELRKLAEANVPMPKTVFGKLDELPFPFVVKSTTSSRAREVWKVENEEDLERLKKEQFKLGKFYFAQEFIPNAKRARLLVIGDREAKGATVAIRTLDSGVKFGVKIDKFIEQVLTNIQEKSLKISFK